MFAPTDAAFAKLPAGTVDGLLKDKTRLTEILLFHVAKGKTASKWIVNGSGQFPTCVHAKRARSSAPPETALCQPSYALSFFLLTSCPPSTSLCELPDPKIGTWKVVMCVDEHDNGASRPSGGASVPPRAALIRRSPGKNGKPLKIGQRCATVQGSACPLLGKLRLSLT